MLDRSRFSSESEDGVRPMKPRNGVNNYQLIHNQLEESNSDEEDSLFDKVFSVLSLRLSKRERWVSFEFFNTFQIST